MIQLLYLALTYKFFEYILPHTDEFLSEWFGDEENDWIKRVFGDLVTAMVGLQILLLAVLTIEHRFNLSSHFYFKPRGQTCMRVTMTLIIFTLVIVCTAVALLIRIPSEKLDLDLKLTGKKKKLVQVSNVSVSV